MLTEDRPVLEVAAPTAADTRTVAVVLPMVSDYDWSIFDQLPETVPMIVVDDSDGRLSPPPRANVRIYGYAAQQEVMGGRHYAAIPHKTSATRNFGHYLAYREGFDVIVALDYDCRLRAGWLEQHLAHLGPVTAAPAVAGAWINPIDGTGFFARGYPYEARDLEAPVRAAEAAGEVKLNLGLWDVILDINGIDKLLVDVPESVGELPEVNRVALGNLPLCGMNTAFVRELVPAYFFMPDVLIDSWRMSRHDDIWGGYVLKRLMDRRGDLISYGRPVIDHLRQSDIEKVIRVEHHMHLLAGDFFAIVDEAAERVAPGGYDVMFAAFTEEYRRALEARPMPGHHRRALGELGDAMDRWRDCFR